MGFPVCNLTLKSVRPDMHPETDILRQRYSPDGSPLRLLQSELLKILCVVAQICDRHAIPYWISGGTLLGAVVHDGFIPWDDDVDIELMRSDYLRLLTILPAELPQHLYLQTPRDKGYTLCFAKVRDRHSIVRMKDDDLHANDGKGFYIDIVPVERGWLGMKKAVEFFYGRAFRRIKKGNPVRSAKTGFEYAVSLFLYPVGVVLRSFARGLAAALKPGTVVYGYGITARHAQHITDILPVSRIGFEGRGFSAPANPERYLLAQYRCDYTVIPPEEGRPQHFIDFEYLSHDT